MPAKVEITAPTTLEFQIAVALTAAVDGHGDAHASRCARFIGGLRTRD